jgi:hypothetical protein
VTGRQEIWQTLQVVLDILWNGGDDMDTDGGLATAQQILTAAEITVPSGDLADGAYDGFGAFYALPEHIVSDPLDIVATEAPKAADPAEGSGDTKDVPIVETKRVINPEDRITVKARRSDGVVKDLIITASKKDSIQLLGESFTEAAKVSHYTFCEIILANCLQDPTTEASETRIHGQIITSRRIPRNRRMEGGTHTECINI